MLKHYTRLISNLNFEFHTINLNAWNKFILLCNIILYSDTSLKRYVLKYFNKDVRVFNLLSLYLSPPGLLYRKNIKLLFLQRKVLIEFRVISPTWGLIEMIERFKGGSHWRYKSYCCTRTTQCKRTSGFSLEQGCAAQAWPDTEHGWADLCLKCLEIVKLPNNVLVIYISPFYNFVIGSS